MAVGANVVSPASRSNRSIGNSLRRSIVEERPERTPLSRVVAVHLEGWLVEAVAAGPRPKNVAGSGEAL